MKFGITVPNNWGIEEPSEVLHIGKYYEDLEFDSLWTMDHLFNIGYIGKRLNDKPYYHPLATLSCISALTTKTDFFSSSFKSLASFATLVVFPAP